MDIQLRFRLAILLAKGTTESADETVNRCDEKLTIFTFDILTSALISPDRTRNATVKCLTPVHAIEVSREYFEKVTLDFLVGSSDYALIHCPFANYSDTISTLLLQRP